MPIRILTSALLFAAVTAASAQRLGNTDPGITVFEDIGFGGRNATFVREAPSLRSSGLDGRISSLRIARGEYWEVCDGRDFAGSCQVFSGDQPDLRDARWNDKISSLRPVRSAARGRSPAPEVFGALSSPLELYAGTNYSGQRVAVAEATTDLRRRDFNDRALSVRVPRGQPWELCVNADFDDCRLVDADMPDLSTIGISRLVSSVRPQVARGRGQGGRGPRLVLYQSPGFRGRAVTIESSVGSLEFFADLTGSAEVLGGRWELCDRPRFGGNCATVSDSVRDLRTLNLRAPVVSVRPR